MKNNSNKEVRQIENNQVMVMMIIEADQFHSRYRTVEIRKLTLEQRGRLYFGLIDAGMTIRDVARVLGCTKDTAVHLVINISRGNCSANHFSSRGLLKCYF